MPQIPTFPVGSTVPFITAITTDFTTLVVIAFFGITETWPYSAAT